MNSRKLGLKGLQQFFKAIKSKEEFKEVKADFDEFLRSKFKDKAKKAKKFSISALAIKISHIHPKMIELGLKNPKEFGLLDMEFINLIQRDIGDNDGKKILKIISEAAAAQYELKLNAIKMTHVEKLIYPSPVVNKQNESSSAIPEVKLKHRAKSDSHKGRSKRKKRFIHPTRVDIMPPKSSAAIASAVSSALVTPKQTEDAPLLEMDEAPRNFIDGSPEPKDKKDHKKPDDKVEEVRVTQKVVVSSGPPPLVIKRKKLQPVEEQKEKRKSDEIQPLSGNSLAEANREKLDTFKYVYKALRKGQSGLKTNFLSQLKKEEKYLIKKNLSDDLIVEAQLNSIIKHAKKLNSRTNIACELMKEFGDDISADNTGLVQAIHTESFKRSIFKKTKLYGKGIFSEKTLMQNCGKLTKEQMEEHIKNNPTSRTANIVNSLRRK